MIDVSDLATYVGGDAVRDETRLTIALAAANADLDRVLANPWREVPDALRDAWTLDTAANYYRRGANQDNGLLATPDGTTITGVANDPLQKSWPAMKRYINRV